MAQIKNITAQEILDSRGIPALQVLITLTDGTEESASFATELFPPAFGMVDIRDHDEKRFEGNGLLQAVTMIEHTIRPRIIGIDSLNQQEIDKVLLGVDITQRKSQIGANTLITISMAVAKTAAKSKKLPLFEYLRTILGTQHLKMPTPIFTMIEGGQSVNYVTDMHEFLMIPASFKSYSDGLQLGVALHTAIMQILKKGNIVPFMGEKGGFGPLLNTNEDALSLIVQALESINSRVGYDAYVGIDVNANTLYKDKHYKIKDHSMAMSSQEFIDLFKVLFDKYHILYLEDPLSDEDIDGWTKLYFLLNQNAIIAGDYFIATNPIRLQMAIEKKAINGIVIKPSYIGTVTESLAVASMAQTAGLKVIVSDRTGETNETFLADFAVSIGADYVRFGAPVRGERVAKYNRLLEIEKQLSQLITHNI